jgi:hypothetical protein
VNHGTHHHRIYYLTCDEFDSLLASSDECCQRCGARPEKLQVDHDHGAWEAVRGLVCAKCNTRIGAAERGTKTMDVLTWAYLRRAWWRTHRPYCAPWVAEYVERWGRVAA